MCGQLILTINLKEIPTFTHHARNPHFHSPYTQPHDNSHCGNIIITLTFSSLAQLITLAIIKQSFALYESGTISVNHGDSHFFILFLLYLLSSLSFFLSSERQREVERFIERDRVRAERRENQGG
jgi:hypothetical protein